MNRVQCLKKHLLEIGDAQIAQHSQGFFKTGAGEYGEGDRFIGVRVPVLRRVARQNSDLETSQVEQLLQSEVHEERLLALLIFVLQFTKAKPAERKQIYDSYCRHMQFINNWDLVDSSAHWIPGPYLADRSRKPLYVWAKSENLWERRIAMTSTLAYIKQNDFEDTLRIARSLLNDPQELIHKAVGWMLREVGKRDLAVEIAFLQSHYKSMPRTMLRYAIERFPESQRQAYLKGTA